MYLCEVEEEQRGPQKLQNVKLTGSKEALEIAEREIKKLMVVCCFVFVSLKTTHCFKVFFAKTL